MCDIVQACDRKNRETGHLKGHRLCVVLREHFENNCGLFKYSVFGCSSISGCSSPTWWRLTYSLAHHLVNQFQSSLPEGSPPPRPSSHNRISGGEIVEQADQSGRVIEIGGVCFGHGAVVDIQYALSQPYCRETRGGHCHVVDQSGGVIGIHRTHTHNTNDMATVRRCDRLKDVTEPHSSGNEKCSIVSTGVGGTVVVAAAVRVPAVIVEC